MLGTITGNVAKRLSYRGKIILDSCPIFFINKNNRRLPTLRKKRRVFVQ